MADWDQVARLKEVRLKEGINAWNEWRYKNRGIEIDLSGVNLSELDLSGVNLSGANLLWVNLSQVNLFGANLSGAHLSGAILLGTTLSGADLTGANLSGADLYRAYLIRANLRGANLRGTQLPWADLSEAHLSEAHLSGVNLSGASLLWADLTGADLRGADLRGANLSRANLRGANLSGADLRGASMVETDLEGANLTGCRIYGISAWNLNLENTIQSNLIITTNGEPVVRIDDLEVAQFVYLLLKHEKIRNVIQTIGQKAVLLLGRFSPERKQVLDAIADHLRQKGYLPIIFDFEKSTQRDFTETIKILAGLSLFIIADITNPKCSPLELQATVPDYMVPFVPIIQKGEEPFSMFADLKQKYGDWVLDVRRYESKEKLIANMDEHIIKPAIEKHKELVLKRAEKLNIIELK